MDSPTGTKLRLVRRCLLWIFALLFVLAVLGILPVDFTAGHVHVTTKLRILSSAEADVLDPGFTRVLSSRNSLLVCYRFGSIAFSYQGFVLDDRSPQE